MINAVAIVIYGDGNVEVIHDELYEDNVGMLLEFVRDIVQDAERRGKIGRALGDPDSPVKSMILHLVNTDA